MQSKYKRCLQQVKIFKNRGVGGGGVGEGPDDRKKS